MALTKYKLALVSLVVIMTTRLAFVEHSDTLSARRLNEVIARSQRTGEQVTYGLVGSYHAIGSLTGKVVPNKF